MSSGLTVLHNVISSVITRLEENEKKMDTLLIRNGAGPRRIVRLDIFEGLHMPVQTLEDFNELEARLENE